MNVLHTVAQSISENRLDIPKQTLQQGQITNGLQIIFGVAAAVALLFVAISAIKISLSRGNAQEVVKQRDSIVYALIGLAVTFSGFLIVTFVVERV